MIGALLLLPPHALHSMSTLQIRTMETTMMYLVTVVAIGGGVAIRMKLLMANCKNIITTRRKSFIIDTFTLLTVETVLKKNPITDHTLQ
jgi:glycerol-3-phosphate responsive antiterminator